MTNKQLKRMVITELERDSVVDIDSIGVEVSDGVVTLTGHVNTFTEKWSAEETVKAVDGVLAVANDVTVRLPLVRDDTTIAEAALLALKWNKAIPHERIKVVVENGRIVLEGEVDTTYQRRCAERAVRDLKGAMGVSNAIVVAGLE